MGGASSCGVADGRADAGDALVAWDVLMGMVDGVLLSEDGLTGTGWVDGRVAWLGCDSKDGEVPGEGT